jgi:uncharacterized protein
MTPANVHSYSYPPVSVDFVQKLEPGCERELEQIITDLTTAAEAFDGYLGVNIFRPTKRASPQYRIMFRFDRMSSLRQWETSAIRRRLLKRTERLIARNSKWQITGLETWFALSTQQNLVPPPRHKMLFVACLVAIPTINVINLFLDLLPPLPILLRGLISMVLLLSLMTYVLMPRMTKLLADWLYPPTSNKSPIK